jgi:hypothetical protein
MIRWSTVWLLAAGLCPAAPLQDPADFDANIAPFAALRAGHQADLTVHEQYQDAVRRFGIEGHLRAMTEEYQLLVAGHNGEVMYQYLAARSLIGRNTSAAIQALTIIAAQYPDFAPAHRTLAEIYATEAFRDLALASAEREKFVALFPKWKLEELQPPLPEPSPLLGRAELLLRDDGETKQIAQLAEDAIRADEWRLQRIRAFDWYSASQKRQSVRDMQSEYWRLWDLQVRCFRKSGQSERAAQLLAAMRQRAAMLPDTERLRQVEHLQAEENR